MPMMFMLFMKFDFLSVLTLSSIIFTTFILMFSFTQILSSFSFFFYDMLSFSMIILTLISFILIMLSSFNPKTTFPFISCICATLLICFSASNTILFYIMFETVLIPTLLIITMESKSPERLQAGIYLLLYTIFGSLPLLIGLLWYSNFSSFPFINSTLPNFNYPLVFLLAFLVKLPMFFMHLWLPKAHVEAPLEGSMILAAILLKLGGYGMIRIIPTLLLNFYSIKFLLISIGISGAIFTSLNCIRQKDIKALIAYSSVAHMGLVIAAISSLKPIGISSAILMMIAHGLSSSSLFFLVTILYNQTHSRNIMVFKSLIILFPNITLWLFIFLAINFSAPPSFNMISETMIISSLSHLDILNLIILFLAIMFTATFSVVLYANISHNISHSHLPTHNPPHKIFLSLSLHAIPIILISTKTENFMMLF
uniref:NADH-ubiquinone oxidoreductase chain 4 n=1 Tax=Cyriopagopus hainanus TaxID=2781057 RepID=A0A7M1IB28_CYRHA|nr:NADH dehydrogenase subunit 4 [Cyriopagopus hainanus]QOQ36842.1 NADH dehydrogenase subunit 4 [Cyriopagopus hainanus]